METALYFPYIRVPETPWFTQVLLYWDAAAAIVPGDMHDYEAQLGGYMNGLVGAHLVRTIRPDRAFSGNSSEFDERFLAMLDAREFPETSRARPDFGLVRLHQWRWTRLHAEEASRRLFGELEDRGLAVHQGYDEDHTAEWWAVENETADLYLAYLTGSVCRKDSSLFPVTDTSDSLISLTVPGEDDVASRLRALRYATITQALPAPSRPVPVDELVSFKDRHGDQLSRLRHYLNGQLVDLAMIDDDSARDAKTESVLQAIHDDVAVLTEQMLRRRWPRIILVGVGGLVTSALAIGTALASGGTALALGLGITGGLASMGPAGYQAVDLLRSPRFDEHSPLAYAALAQAL